MTRPARGRLRPDGAPRLRKDATLSTGAPPYDLEARFDLLGVTVDNISAGAALDLMEGWVRAGERRTVAFVNAACLNTAADDATYRDVLSRSDLVLPDGVGVRIGARMNGIGVVDNVNGTDLFPRLCERAAATGAGLYLLGSAPGVARTAGAVMAARYPGLRVVGSRDGYFSPEDDEDVVADVNASGAGYLLVALGVPRQELWLDAVADRLEVPVRMGVGALFDLTSGRVRRAPRPVRAARLEWAWRLAMEPRRMWRRYVLGNPRFLARAYRDARRRSAHPTARPGGGGRA